MGRESVHVCVDVCSNVFTNVLVRETGAHSEERNGGREWEREEEEERQRGRLDSHDKVRHESCWWRRWMGQVGSPCVMSSLTQRLQAGRRMCDIIWAIKRDKDPESITAVIRSVVSFLWYILMGVWCGVISPWQNLFEDSKHSDSLKA